MTRTFRRYAAWLLLLPAACDRAPPAAQPVARATPKSVPTASVTDDKSIMRPAIQAEAPPIAVAPAAPTVTTILFGYDAVTLDDAARAMLDRLVRDPATSTAKAIILRGHTDAAGNDRANLHVSRKRATAVRDYLVAAQVSAPITLIAMGERRPARPGATLDGADDPAGRAANRRVELTLVPR